jgi:hypothetical protein
MSTYPALQASRTDISQMLEFLGDRAAMAPVDGALVVVEHWDALGGIREFEVGHEMVEHLGGLAALVHRDYLSLAGAARG